MPNIKFSYLYRDAGNYKNYGAVVFSNAGQINIDDLMLLIKQKLIDGEFFYCGKWELPDLYFARWNPILDHSFHEFESIEYTIDPPNTLLNLAEFVKLINHSK